MEDLISVIIPVYNVENHIEKCLESIIHQTYDNLQIILVDDGSSDNSGNICDEFQKKDSRIEVIHQKNAGVSNARNNGLTLAKGKYIAFCDADDWVEQDMYEYLYQLLENSEYSIASCGVWLETKENRTAVGYSKKVVLNLSVSDAIAELHLGQYTNPWLWSKMFSASAIKDMLFDEKLKAAEDYLFVCEAIEKCKGMICGNKVKYHYVQRKSSACNNGYTEDMEKGYFVIKQNIERYIAIFPDKHKKLYAKYILDSMGILTAMIKGNCIDRKKVSEIQKIIRKSIGGYIFTKGVKFHLKASAIVICINFNLFESVYRKNKKFG